MLQVCFTAFRAVEHHPDSQIAGEVFEAVRDAGRGEEDVGWSKRSARVAANKLTGAGSNEVELVACVRLLWVGAARRIDLHQQTAVLKDGGKALSFRAGQEFECSCDVSA